MIHLIQQFKKRATEEELAALVEASGTTAFYLFHHLGIHRPFTLPRAEAIEDFTTQLAKDNGGRTPVVSRTQLCDTCRRCPHAQGSGSAGDV